MVRLLVSLDLRPYLHLLGTNLSFICLKLLLVIHFIKLKSKDPNLNEFLINFFFNNL